MDINRNVQAAPDPELLPTSALRSTQRPPRSCQSCTERKVKCDKRVPCSRCLRRGEASTCARETVLVRGRVTTFIEPETPGQPAYDDLLRENRRLRESLAEAERKVAAPRVHGGRRGWEDALCAIENRILKEGSGFFQDPGTSAGQASIKMTWDEIMLPSRATSDALISHDRVWNSWVHYAVEYPQFEGEHLAFWASMDAGCSLHDADPGWMAVYFALLTANLLTMEDGEIERLDLPADGPDIILRHWFSASIFFLHEADFLRRWTLRTVQTIAILGTSFVNLGEQELYETLWAIAIRISQNIGIDRPAGPSATHDSILSPEGRCRLWWTLVICEWLFVPYHTPLVVEWDFDAPLPTVDGAGMIKTPDGSTVHMVQYHIFMARTATVYGRFREAFYRSARSVDEIVRRADEQLAEVIDTLPIHLQPDQGHARWIRRLEAAHPWIAWQRFDITLVLLHHRLRINMTLQAEWHAEPERYDWARSICLGTARDVLWISNSWDQPVEKRRQWALTLHLFTAAMFIIGESRTGALETAPWRNELRKCLQYFDLVKSHSVIAHRAANELRMFIEKAEETADQAT